MDHNQIIAVTKWFYWWVSEMNEDGRGICMSHKEDKDGNITMYVYVKNLPVGAKVILTKDGGP